MRLLIYGAGVIGCLYAALFAEAGYDTAVFARGKRLETLERVGLLYEARGQTHKAAVRVMGKLADDDMYDFIFLTVRENQVHTALNDLSCNISPNIVTMVNTLEPYSEWEKICGSGRIVPAFPGAGGWFDKDILKAALTPRLIQPTTFAEISGVKTERISRLSMILKSSGIPCQVVKDMHSWQLCHLAMVVPIADAYYEANDPEQAWREKKVMIRAARQMKSNFKALYHSGITLSPLKMHLFRLLPVCILGAGLTLTFKSSFGNVFMYRHSVNAPDEMRQLHDQFYRYIRQDRFTGLQ